MVLLGDQVRFYLKKSNISLNYTFLELAIKKITNKIHYINEKFYFFIGL